MLTRHSYRGADHGSRTHPGLKRNSSAYQWRACSTGSAISPSVAANGEQTEMIRANLRGTFVCHFALQSADASLVGCIGYRHQLGVRISSSHRVEPDTQILLKPQMLTLDRYRRKAGRLHRRDDGLRRPEILQVDSVSLREIFIIEPVRALLWTKIAHDKTRAVSKNR